MNKNYLFLIIIFIITLSLRLFFAFQTPYFSLEAYDAVRHVEHIRSTGLPLFKDTLSYGGRQIIFLPLFYYILAFFDLFLPEQVVFKLLPNLFISSLVFIVFLIADHIAKSRKIALFASLLSGFIPFFYYKTINDISVYSLVIPLTAMLIFCFMKIRDDKRYVVLFIALTFLLRLVHPSVLLLSVALLLFLLLIKLTGLKQSRIELELILFSTFLILWSLFITFKKAFLAHGYSVIWQNIPGEVLNKFFTEISILEAISKIGIIPFFFGLHIIYKYIFIEKKREIYLLISFALLVSILLLLKLIKLDIGLMFLSVISVLLFSQSLKMILVNFGRTRFSRFKFHLFIFVCIIFFLTSVIPSITYANKSLEEALKPEEVKALSWLRDNSDEEDIVLATLQEGFLIASVAGRKNVADYNFLLIEDADARVKDIRTIYTALFQTEAVRLLDKYDVKYIYFSERAKNEFDIQKLGYIDDKCFELVYSNNNIEIYKILCWLQEG